MIHSIKYSRTSYFVPNERGGKLYKKTKSKGILNLCDGITNEALTIAIKSGVKSSSQKYLFSILKFQSNMHYLKKFTQFMGQGWYLNSG